MTGQEILDRIADAALETLFLPREIVMAELRTWEVEPHWRDGRVYGAVLRRGAELHFATFDGVPIGRRTVAAALRPQLDRFGYVETRTPRHARRQQRFNEAIGFRAVGGGPHDIHYRMEKAQCRLPLQ